MSGPFDLSIITNPAPDEQRRLNRRLTFLTRLRFSLPYPISILLSQLTFLIALAALFLFILCVPVYGSRSGAFTCL